MPAKPKPGTGKRHANHRQKWIWSEKKTINNLKKHQEIQPNVGHQKKIDKNMRSLFKVFLNVGFCCFVCLCIFCVLFETVCHFVCYFGVLQVHPCVHEVSLNFGIAVCCTAVAAVVFCFFWVWPKPSWNLPNRIGTQFFQSYVWNQGPERTSYFKEDWASKGNQAYPCMAHKRAAIPTMDHD